MARRTPQIGERTTRAFTLERRSLDEASRSVDAVLSSEAPVRTFFGEETLVHDQAAVDLSRDRGNGFPLLHAHDSSELIGRVRDVRLERRHLVGRLEFSSNSERAREAFENVRDGFLDGISIGFRIERFETEPESDEIRVTRWTLLEASTVAIPADANAMILRSYQMNDPTRPTEPTADNVLSIADWSSREHTRRKAIRATFEPYVERGERYRRLLEDALDDPSVTEATANERLLQLLGDDSAEYVRARGDMDYRQSDRGGLIGTSDIRELGRAYPFHGGIHHRGGEFRAACVDALVMRAGYRLKDPHPATGDVRGLSLSDILRTMMSQRGMPAHGTTSADLFSRRALIGNTTSDFSSLLADVFSKALRVGMEEALASYRAWVNIVPVRDFKTVSRVSLGSLGDLEEIPEAGDYKYKQRPEAAESYTITTHGAIFSVTRQALINDDLQAFQRFPRDFTAAAVRKKADLVYDILTTNPTMAEDSTALFHANHNNDVAAGSGAPPSVSTLEAALAAMRTQAALGGGFADPVPRFLIVPAALEVTARSVINASQINLGAEGATTDVLMAEGALNPFGNMEVVVDPRLDADDAAQWYVAADPRTVDTVELGFLDGTEEGVSLEENTEFTSDGIAWKVRLEAGAAAIDWRGLYRNDGN